MRPKMIRPQTSRQRIVQRSPELIQRGGDLEMPPTLPVKMDKPQTSAARFNQKQVRSDGLIPTAERAVLPVSSDAADEESRDEEDSDEE